MKHAGAQTLDELDELLESLRKLPQLVEKKRGTFYRKSSAFMHFHEDPAGIFADVKSDGEFCRFEANTAKQRAAVLAYARSVLGKTST